MIISYAERVELDDILSLQYQAYRSEAELLNDFSIPPLSYWKNYSSSTTEGTPF